MDKIQLTKEQARDLYDFFNDADIFDEFYSDLKRAGYIKQSAVEEAEEMYGLYFSENSGISTGRLLEKQHEAIQYLKERQK